MAKIRDREKNKQTREKESVWGRGEREKREGGVERPIDLHGQVVRRVAERISWPSRSWLLTWELRWFSTAYMCIFANSPMRSAMTAALIAPPLASVRVASLLSSGERMQALPGWVMLAQETVMGKLAELYTTHSA